MRGIAPTQPVASGGSHDPQKQVSAIALVIVETLENV
jgi:hypothetical protein